MKKGKITAIFMAMTLAATAFAGCGTRADGKEEITVRSDNTETESEHTETEAEHIETEETTEADSEVQMEETVSIDQELAAVEEKSQEMYERLGSGELTQIEMNQLSLELFQLWDEELNSLWSRLMDKLDADEKEQLKEEEREWIKKKDQEVKAAGSEMEGGSMQPLLENDKAAELTRERVYELAERLKGE